MLFFPTKKSRMYIVIIPIKKTFSGMVIVEYAELLYFAFRRRVLRPNLMSVSYDVLSRTLNHIQYLGARLGCFHWGGSMRPGCLKKGHGLSIIKWRVLPTR